MNPSALGESHFIENEPQTRHIHGFEVMKEARIRTRAAGQKLKIN